MGNCETEFLILGRPVIDGIGCDNRSMIAAACNRNDGIIKVPGALTKRVQNQPNQGSIAALLSNGVYHSAGGYEDDGINSEDDVYIGLVEDSDA